MREIEELMEVIDEAFDDAIADELDIVELDIKTVEEIREYLWMYQELEV